MDIHLPAPTDEMIVDGKLQMLLHPHGIYTKKIRDEANAGDKNAIEACRLYDTSPTMVDFLMNLMNL